MAFGGGVEEDIVRGMDVECERDPLFPLTVSWYVPGAAPEVADIVSVDEAVPPDAGVTAEGLRVAVTPDMDGETASDTWELKPLVEPTLMVDVCELPPAVT